MWDEVKIRFFERRFWLVYRLITVAMGQKDVGIWPNSRICSRFTDSLRGS